MAISWPPGYTKATATPTVGKCQMSLEEFKQWLKHFDADRDGRISKEELRHALHRRGGRFNRWNGGRGVRCADTDCSGFIDDDEIQNLISFAEDHLRVTVVPH